MAYAIVLNKRNLSVHRGTIIKARDVLEIVESRYQNASTIFCSQFEPRGWYEQIGEATLADAILDRVIHSSHSIFIDGKVSMRERLGIQS